MYAIRSYYARLVDQFDERVPARLLRDVALEQRLAAGRCEPAAHAFLLDDFRERLVEARIVAHVDHLVRQFVSYNFV